MGNEWSKFWLNMDGDYWACNEVVHWLDGCFNNRIQGKCLSQWTPGCQEGRAHCRSKPLVYIFIFWLKKVIFFVLYRAMQNGTHQYFNPQSDCL